MATTDNAISPVIHKSNERYNALTNPVTTKILAQRIAEYKILSRQFPDKIYIIAYSSNAQFEAKYLPPSKHLKFVATPHTTIREFISKLRTKCNLSPEMAIILFMCKAPVDNTDTGLIVPTTSSSFAAYNDSSYLQPDGFLYIDVQPENVFG